MLHIPHSLTAVTTPFLSVGFLLPYWPVPASPVDSVSSCSFLFPHSMLTHTEKHKMGPSTKGKCHFTNISPAYTSQSYLHYASRDLTLLGRPPDARCMQVFPFGSWLRPRSKPWLLSKLQQVRKALRRATDLFGLGIIFGSALVPFQVRISSDVGMSSPPKAGDRSNVLIPP